MERISLFKVKCPAVNQTPNTSPNLFRTRPCTDIFLNCISDHLKCRASLVGYDFDSESDTGSSPFSKMSGKKLAALAILVIIGAVFGVQFLFGFPLRDLFERGSY